VGPVSSTVVDAFTELAPDYEATLDAEIRQMLGISYRQFVDRLIAAIPLRAGDTVLDVATGTGVIPLQIAQGISPACRIAGLDITPAMLAHAQARAQAAGLSSLIWNACANGMRMPFAAGAFDVVTCGLGMHHMEGGRLLREMRRVLKPGGGLAMADVAASSFWRSFPGGIWLRLLMVYFGMTHSRSRMQAEVDALANLHTRDEWLANLEGCGFTDVCITELRPRRGYYPVALLITARAGST
jgi:ubiquinone/menaquinone biosynthesis C-methylase UbiE